MPSLKKRFAESDMKTRWVCNEQGIMKLFGAVAFKKYERDTKVTWIYHTMNWDTSKVFDLEHMCENMFWRHVSICHEHAAKIIWG